MHFLLKRFFFLFRFTFYLVASRCYSTSELERFIQKHLRERAFHDFVHETIPLFRTGDGKLAAIFREWFRRLERSLGAEVKEIAYPKSTAWGDMMIHLDMIHLLNKAEKKTMVCPALPRSPFTELVPLILDRDEVKWLGADLLKEIFDTAMSSVDHDGGFELKGLLNVYINSILFKNDRRQKNLIYRKYYPEQDPVAKILKRENGHRWRIYKNWRPKDNSIDGHREYVKLLLKEQSRTPVGYSKDHLDILLKELGVCRPYFCLHIRLSDSEKRSPRSVEKPDNYLKGLRSLGEQGFQIVLICRAEEANDKRWKPIFDLENVINYGGSGNQSPKNDLHLVAGSQGFVGCCSGPINYPHLFRKPALYLNHVFGASGVHLPEQRFYPKNFLKNGVPASLEEWLNSAIIYTQYDHDYKNLGWDYEDLTEDQVEEALLEFVGVCNAWSLGSLTRTPLQNDFFAMTHEEHLNLHFTHGAPCDSYLYRMRRMSA